VSRVAFIADESARRVSQTLVAIGFIFTCSYD
jgi:hypothetical protein